MPILYVGRSDINSKTDAPKAESASCVGTGAPMERSAAAGSSGCHHHTNRVNQIGIDPMDGHPTKIPMQNLQSLHA